MPVLPQVDRVQIPNFAATIIAGREAKRNAALDERKMDMEGRRLDQADRRIDIDERSTNTTIDANTLKATTEKVKGEKEKVDLAMSLFGRANNEQAFKVAGQLFLKQYPDERPFLNSLFPNSQYDQEKADGFKRMLITASKLSEDAELKGFSPGSDIYKDGVKVGSVPFKPKEDKEITPSAIGKLISEAEATGSTFTPGQKGKIYADAIIKSTSMSKGQSLTVTKDGEVILDQGGQQKVDRQAPGMGIPATNIIQKQLVDATSGIARLSQIEQTFDKNFTTIPGKFKAGFLNLKDKMTGELTGDEADFMTKQSTFAQNAIENINLYIKEITGAQMSEAEADRLRKAVADIGDSFLAGDGPVRFQSKLNNQMKKLRMSVARLHWANSNGLQVQRNKAGNVVAFFDDQGNTIEMESMPDIINKRAAEIGEELKKTGIKSDLINAAVRKRVAQEFGLIPK